MHRRKFIVGMSAVAALPLVGRFAQGRFVPTPEARAEIGGDGTKAASAGDGDQTAPAGDWEPLEKSEEEWRRILSEAEFEILRDEGTERAGSSPLNEEHRTGTFICAACFLPLFRSEDKFMSGTGWPSFTRPIEGHVGTKPDIGFFVVRTEYHCARCEGHQGHVFEDGPEPTGQRWCNNGLALDFVPEEEALPELRT